MRFTFPPARTAISVTALAALIAAPAAMAQTPDPVSLLPRVVQAAAAAYAEYQGEVTTISSAPLKDAGELDKALDTFGAQNADQLSAGWISYSALIASQNKEFSTAVRDIDGYYGRERVMTGLRNDVGYARTLKGGDKALAQALAVNTQDSGRISSAAAFVKSQAYKLQDIAWGKSRLKDPGGTATQLKVSAKSTRPIAEAASKFFATPDLNLVLANATGNSSAGSVWDKISLITASAPAAALGVPAGEVAAAPAPKIDPKREGTANRIVTLAALHVLEAEQTNETDVKAAMKDKSTFDCIDWSQLQLQACVSAAYTRADLSFCLAEHAIGDAGKCFSGVTK
jgi:hypothetical protein